MSSIENDINEVLDRIIALQRQNIRLELEADRLGALALALFSRFEQLGSLEDLGVAIVYLRQALELRPPGHPDRSKSLNDLTIAVHTRFEQLGKMEDLEEAIACHRQALDLRPPGHPHRSVSLTSLAIAVHTRFKQFGKMEDLEEAIACHRQALDLCPPGHPDHTASLNNLAVGVCTRFEQSGKMEDLEEAIACHRQALDLHPPGHPHHSASLNNLALGVRTRFEQFGKMEDPEEAIACHRQALDLHPPGHPHRSASLSSLAIAVHTRFEQFGKMEDLEEAIACHRQALDLDLPGHPGRSASLNNLALSVHTRFEQFGKMEDLEEAIACHRQALDLHPPGHPHRSAFLSSLAITVYTRFKQFGKMEDLEEAIACHRQALDLRLPGHPGRSASLNDLAVGVRTRFEQFGKMEDLEEAIACHRQALDLRPPGHPHRSASLSCLAIAVHTRFEQFGKMEDLEEAIACDRQALDLHLPGHPGRSASLNNLALGVRTRFEQFGKMEDLEEAIACHRQALDLHPPGYPHRSASLSSLAITVHTRFKQFGKMEDLEEAIACQRQALDLCPPGHPSRIASLSNLASTVYTRFQHLGIIEDLEELVKWDFEADAGLMSDHPRRATTMSNLASSTLKLLHYAPSSYRAPHMMFDPFALFESASHRSASRAQDRFLAARRWVHDARRYHHSSILNAYSTALACLHRHVSVTPTVQSWQKSLALVPRSLVSDAASSAIEAGNLETAVELLEQGRTILWAKMRGYRHSLEKLRDVHEDLANEFDSVSRELEHHAVSSDVDSVLPVFFDRQTRRHRLLSEKWDEVVGRIRQMDGFETFLRAIPFASLQLAAAGGPVIIVNISQYRSDAIILQQHDPPVLVNLADALPDMLHQLSMDLSAALTLDDDKRGKAILPVLQDLWAFVVSPVVDRLATLGVEEMSRIWWCPTSHLCALPLHAAGPYCPQQKNLPDIYTSSYTLTLSSLITARSHLVPRPTAPKLLAMGQSNDNLEKSRLPLAREELRRIQSLGDSVDVLLGEQINRETLLPLLQQYPWVHFACHGHIAANEPFLSSFQLHDNERLTLTDLIKARLPNAELAFLSACHRAAVDVNNTPDEVIHLAAALQFCGFRSVIGSFWAMADVDGPDIAEGFYRYMFRDVGSGGDFRDSAVALNHATRDMRRRYMPALSLLLVLHLRIHKPIHKDSCTRR